MERLAHAEPRLMASHFCTNRGPGQGAVSWHGLAPGKGKARFSFASRKGKADDLTNIELMDAAEKD